MSQQGSHEVVFHDASSCFSEEEWALLQEWQKDLYRNVMKEIHQALISLGPLITSTVVSLRTKDKLELCSTDTPNSSRTLSINNSPKGDIVAIPGVFGKNHNNEVIHLKYPQDTVERSRNLSQNAESAFGNNGPGLNTEEPRVVLIDHLGAEVEEISSNPNPGSAFSANVPCVNTEDPNVVLIDDLGAEEGEISNSLNADYPVVTAVYSLSYTGQGLQYRYIPTEQSADIVSVTIKDEEEVYSMAQQESQQIENSAETGNEMMNRAEKLCYSSRCSETTPLSNSFFRQVRTDVAQSSQMESASRSQDWVIRGDNSPQCGSSVSNPAQFNVSDGSPATERSDSECDLNVNNLDFLNYFPCTGQIPNLPKFAERNNGRAGVPFDKQATHERERKYPCTKCNNRFFSKSNLNEHYRVHDRHRKYPCSECSHRFLSKKQLVVHQNRHLRERNGQSAERSAKVLMPARERKYPCTKCEKRFFSKSNLNEHYRVHDGKKTHVCSDCGHRYFSRSQLIAHQKTHSRERTHACDICDKRFFAKSHLAEHYSTHTGKKRYPCTLCHKGFNKKHNLEGHIRTHTGEKPFLCTECGKEFTWKSGCLKHQKSCHGI